MLSPQFPNAHALVQRSGPTRPAAWSPVLLPVMASVLVELVGLRSPPDGDYGVSPAAGLQTAQGVEIVFAIWFLAPLLAMAGYVVGMSLRAPRAVPTASRGSIAFFILTTVAVVSSKTTDGSFSQLVLLILPVLQVATLIGMHQVIIIQKYWTTQNSLASGSAITTTTPSS